MNSYLIGGVRAVFVGKQVVCGTKRFFTVFCFGRSGVEEGDGKDHLNEIILMPGSYFVKNEAISKMKHVCNLNGTLTD